MQRHHGGDVGNHSVFFVDEDAMPGGKEWMFVEFDDAIFFVIDRAKVSAELLEEAWAGYHALGRYKSEQAGGHEPMSGCCPLVGHAPRTLHAS
jgi:hypothetical protein